MGPADIARAFCWRGGRGPRALGHVRPPLALSRDRGGVSAVWRGPFFGARSGHRGHRAAARVWSFRHGRRLAPPPCPPPSQHSAGSAGSMAHRRGRGAAIAAVAARPRQPLNVGRLAPRGGVGARPSPISRHGGVGMLHVCSLTAFRHALALCPPSYEERSARASTRSGVGVKFLVAFGARACLHLLFPLCCMQYNVLPSLGR